jgi:hypothetical protein
MRYETHTECFGQYREIFSNNLILCTQCNYFIYMFILQSVINKLAAQ